MTIIIIWSLLGAAGIVCVLSSTMTTDKNEEKRENLGLIGIIFFVFSYLPAVVYADKDRSSGDYILKNRIEVKLVDGVEIERDTIYTFKLK